MSDKPRILIVDDRAENLFALESLLRCHDAEIARAGSGDEALELLLSQEVALALVDVQMPVMSGFELAELMRGSARTREIPIIFITAGMDDQFRVFKGYEAGAVDFLVKPLESHVLNSKVAIFLELYGKKRQLASRIGDLEAALAGRLRAEEALRLERDRQAWLASISEENPDPVLRVSRDGRVLYANASARSAFELAAQGGASDASIAQAAAELAPPDMFALAEEAFRRGRVHEAEIKRDEDWWWLKVRPEGDCANLYARNISVRRRFDTMAECIPQLIWMARADGYIYWYNSRWYEFTGTTPEQMQGWGWMSVHDPNVLPAVLEGWRRSIALGEPFEMEFPLRGADGAFRRFLTRVHPSKHDDGTVLEWFGTNTDVTELVETREALKASEARYRSLADNVPSLLMRFDRAGRFVYLSPKVEEATGVASARLLGRTPSEALPRALTAGWEEAISRVIQNGASEDVEFSLHGPAGERVFLLRLAPEHGPGHELEHVLAVATEITERKRMENALRENDRRKNEFLAVLSHELRNPLATIKNSLYLLARVAPGTDAAGRAQRVMERQVGQLANLVNDLLDVTRITRGKIELQRELVDLNDVVRSALEDNRLFFEEAEVRLELSTCSQPVHVTADRTRMAQIVSNLLQNSAKFTRPGGRTSVTVGVEQGEATVRVADDGVGMTPETLARLFQPFMQADQTLDRSKGGLGLGLALVKGLVELHGGRISAASAGLERGAEFVLQLPRASEPSRDAGVKPALVARSRRRVLIIEDNLDAGDSLRQLLELRDHDVALARSGPEGLELARSFHPEVVLCDIGLPEMDGYEVARAFRADSQLGAAFLVALSGYASPEDRGLAKEAGFERHLAKPCSLVQLEALLAEMSPVKT